MTVEEIRIMIKNAIENDIDNKTFTTTKEKELYFMSCLARDRGIKPEYFDFDKRIEIEKFNSNEKGCDDSDH